MTETAVGNDEPQWRKDRMAEMQADAPNYASFLRVSALMQPQDSEHGMMLELSANEIECLNKTCDIFAEQVTDLQLEVEKLRGKLEKIDRLVRIPTPQGTRAYTHFMRDFDQIRKATEPRP